MPSEKTGAGNFFEDFKVGVTFQHPTPRTLTSGDKALCNALFPFRHALHSSDEFARRCGLEEAPFEDFSLFHFVFGKSVPDISINAVANLGYAEMRFLRMAFVGDTLSAESRVIGLRETSNGRAGIVWVRTTGFNQRGEAVMEFARWVMVRKRNGQPSGQEAVVPETSPVVQAEYLPSPAGLDFTDFDFAASGEKFRWSDYRPGETIDHRFGVTVEEAEHMMATRLWQNPARLHFDGSMREDGRRLIYGGHVISMARALTFYGLANAQTVVAVNAGSHVSPCFAGNTIHAWSKVLDLSPCAVPGAGAMRLRTVATNGHADVFPEDTKSPNVLLDLDYWVLIPL